MTDYEQRTRRELARVQDRLAFLTRETERAAALRDHLVLQLCDNVGLHDRQPVGVR
jgi:hypothetical protein